MVGTSIADANFSVNSFFAGIGGFDRGFENCGFSVEYICENNPFCNRVLSAHWPEAQRGEDIKAVNPDDIPDATVWCGGFPCQDISVARGAMTRLGLQGNRSGLFYRFAELIAEKAPEVVVIENVAGLFNSNKGIDFGVILTTLDKLGYAISWRLFNSRYFGVPQSRPRVYLCCWKGDPEKALRSLFEQELPVKPKNERAGFITESTPEGCFPRVPTTGYCLAATSGRHTGTDWSRTYVTCKNGVRRLTPVECERLQGFPDNWTLVDADTEDSDSLRYAAIGNAVSVPVVEWVAKRIKGQLVEQSKSDFSSTISSCRVFSNHAWKELPDDIDACEKLKWSKSGIVWDGKYIEGVACEAPYQVATTTLYEIVEKNDVHGRYYLTPNAAEGIIRRVDNNNRHLFPPLREGLELLASKKAKE